MNTSEKQYLRPQGKGRSLLFWTFSAAIHACVGAVLLYSPAKDFIMAKPELKERPPMRIKGRKLEEFVEELRDQTCDELRARVNLLQAGQTRMADNFETLHRHIFKDFEEKQRRTARARLEEYLEKTHARTASMHRLCEEAAAKKRSEKLISAYAGETAQILAGLEEIGRGLRLIDDLGNLVPKQAKALEAQHNALQFLRYHEEAALRKDRYEEEIPLCLEEKEKKQAEIEKLKTAIDERNRKVAAISREMDTAKKAEKRAKLDTIKAKNEQRRARKEKDSKAEKKYARLKKEKEQEAENLNKKVKELEGRRRALNKELGGYKREINNLEKKLEALGEKVDKYRTAIPELEERRKTMLKVSSFTQGGVHWKVKEIVEDVRGYFDEGIVPVVEKEETDEDKKNGGDGK